MQENQPNAEQIHELWVSNHQNFNLNTKYPSRQYYILLRDAMYREMSATGSCKLIERYLQTGSMPAMLYHAACDVLVSLNQDTPLPDVGPEWLIGNGIRFSWSKLGSLWNEPTVDVNAERINELYLKVSGKYRPTGQRPGGAAEEMPMQQPTRDDPRMQHDSILNQARQQRDNIVNQAREQRDNILNQARQQRDGILRDAAIQRSSILTGAEHSAARIIAEAKAEAARILQDAEDSKAEAARTLRDAEERARTEAQSLLSGRLEGYMNQQRRQWEDGFRALDNARADMSEAVPTLKEEVCSVTTSAGARMNQSVDAMIEQLSTLKSELLVNLNQWRSGLYKCEYGPLINFYTNLMAVAAQFERDVITEQTAPMTAQQQMTTIQRHSARMNTLRNNLTRAMEAMGLRTFTPQPGDIFDSYLHATNDAEDDDLYNDRIIESCISPGVERVVNSQVTDVLHRATVKLRSEA